MASFFGRLKNSSFSSSQPSANVPTKKDPNAVPPSPLVKLLADAGPLRQDGSDKFFGFENFGSTCYCNSIIQCLFYSVPFRDQILSFPARAPPSSRQRQTGRDLGAADAGSASHTNGASASSHHEPNKAPAATSKPQPPKKTTTPMMMAPPPLNKPEDKDSPEYKKKQAITTGPVLNIDYENAGTYDMPESLYTSLKDIFEAIVNYESRTGVVSPNKFLDILKRDNEMFRTAMHQDAHEFFNLLLNQVVESVEEFAKNDTGRKQPGRQTSNATKPNGHSHDRDGHSASKKDLNTSWVHELFEGTLTSETRCLTCENVSQRDEAFLDLSVDLEQHSSVTSCLRKFSQEEMLCERNKFHCDNCGGLQEAEKRMKIKRLPRILALHLKRFKYTEDLQRLQKLFHRVVYPYYLRLFNTTDDAEDPDRLYELYAVVVHIGGGPYHGHYVSIIKTEERGWLLFDDEMVEPVDKAFVRHFFGSDTTLACAYVLFYRETTMEAMRKDQEAEGLIATQEQVTALEEGLPGPGTENGTMANGLHHAKSVGHSAMHSHIDKLPSLNHAVSAPADAIGEASWPLPSTRPLDPPPTHPAEPRTTREPARTASVDEASRKQGKAGTAIGDAKGREEGTANAQQPRTTAFHRKESRSIRREEAVASDDDLVAAIQASKFTKAEEDRKHAVLGSDGTTPASTAEEESVVSSDSPRSSSLSRFGVPNTSVRSNVRAASGEPDTDRAGPNGDAVADGPDLRSIPNVPPEPPPVEKKKHRRFSLRRKKSYAVL